MTLTHSIRACSNFPASTLLQPIMSETQPEKIVTSIILKISAALTGAPACSQASGATLLVAVEKSLGAELLTADFMIT